MNFKRENNLLDKFPDVCIEWNHQKNDIPPEFFTPFSSKKVWWRCSKNHEWQATIANRTIANSKCPYCANRRACKDTCLQATHPEIAAEWDHIKNHPLTPMDITYGSQKKIHWICKANNEHKWEAKVGSRTIGKHNCLHCGNDKSLKRVIEYNASLANKNESLFTTHPEIKKEWNFILNIGVDPNKLTHGSNVKVWWSCLKNSEHVWQASIKDKTRSKKHGCPYCHSRKINHTNSLAVLHPDLMKQWHPTKNVGVDPYNIAPKSPTPIWWICDKNNTHEFKARVNSINKLNCPLCKYFKNERKTHEYLKELLSVDFKKERIYVKGARKLKKKFIIPDTAFTINNQKYIVEYDGIQHYQPVKWGKMSKYKQNKNFEQQKLRDAWLKRYCKRNSIILINIDGRKYKDEKIKEILIKKFKKFGLLA